MAANREGVPGFEEARLWLPSQVQDEPHRAKAHLRPLQKHRRHYAHHRLRLPAESSPMQPKTSSPRPQQQRPKIGQNWASGGPGMQAIFLDSSQKPCGTGVFLPQQAGANFPQGKKTTGCAPVLLPSRVVQALNLNVHELGLQVLPRKENVKSKNGGDCISVKNRKGKDEPSSQCCVVSQKGGSSPELFLPKEWTY